MSYLGIIIAHPWLALLPATLFGMLGYRSRRVFPCAVAVMWLLYTGYEEAMKRRILCTGECNIRIDLLLLYPVLLTLSVIAGITAVRGRRTAA